MQFKRIEINGFKSFADPVSIDFTDGITCIVGPNGSGKSNVSDALRWVLGEQSARSLRGGRMEDVIFAGTQSRRSKGMAEVTLVIDNSDRELAIDFAEVAITRRMYRSGESEYLINRAPCRLRDIRDLIMDTGIGVEGYSIIGQGKIADIVSNKMDSRREIFEEAAGIVKYRNRKEEAEKKLESASVNLDRVSDIIFEIESRIGGLEEDSKKAAEYLELRDKYKAVEINIILRNIEQAGSKTEAVNEELREIEEEIAGVMASRDAFAEKLRQLREKGGELEKQLDGIRTALMYKNEDISSAAGKKQLNAQQLDALDRDDERLAAEIEDIKARIARQESAKSELLTRIDELEEAAELSAGRLAEASRRSADAGRRFREAEEAASGKRNELMELSASQAEIRAEMQSAQSLKASLERRLERLAEDDEQKAGSAAELEDKLKASEAAGREAEEALSSLRDSLKAQEEAAAGSASEIEELQKSISALRLERSRLSAREKLFEELESSYEGYGGGVRFIMGRKLPGVIGVLGDLINVPRGWELAIETELGGKMQDIVCEDDGTAREAIALLKKEKAGRLTFLPVSDIRAGKPADVSELAGCRGFLGLASERVSVSLSGRGSAAEAKEIAEYLLGRVVVCDSLDNAVSMSRRDRGLRFVTLEGDIVSAAGAITGGSVRNNTASILTRRSERSDLKKQSSELSKRISEAEQSLQKATVRRGEAEAQLELLRSGIAGRQTDLALLKRSMEQDEQMLKDSRESSERRARESEELRVEIDRAGADAFEAEEKLAALEERADAISRELTALSEGLTGLRAAAESAREAETLQRIKEESSAGELRAAGDRLSALEELEEELSEDLRKKGEGLSSNDIRRKQIEAFGEGADEAIEKMEAEKKAIEQQLAETAALRQKNGEEASEAEEQRLAAESSLYDAQMKKHDAELRQARFDSQTESLKEKLWDEFEISYAQAAEYEQEDFVMSRGLKEAREYRDRMRQIGTVNIGAIEEYKAVKERYEFLTMQRADILQAVDELKTVISDTDATIKARFAESFTSVAENFEETFTELFGGGHARLSLEDPSDPMASAIEIEAQPSGKKLQNINLLSGGEKTMTAIALMFAVLRSKPTPFCILDEVEAALDETNIDRFANYLKNFKNTQFALITHQKATMEHADSLYGVTMPEQGVSKLLSLRLGEDFEM